MFHFYTHWKPPDVFSGYRSGTFVEVGLIDNFGVGAAILCVGTNSGQTFIKCCDLACDVGTTTVRKF